MAKQHLSRYTLTLTYLGARLQLLPTDDRIHSHERYPGSVLREKASHHARSGPQEGRRRVSIPHTS